MKQRHRKHRRPVRDTKDSRRRKWLHAMVNAHPSVIKAWSEALWRGPVDPIPKPA